MFAKQNTNPDGETSAKVLGIVRMPKSMDLSHSVKALKSIEFQWSVAMVFVHLLVGGQYNSPTDSLTNLFIHSIIHFGKHP